MTLAESSYWIGLQRGYVTNPDDKVNDLNGNEPKFAATYKESDLTGVACVSIESASNKLEVKLCSAIGPAICRKLNQGIFKRSNIKNNIY